MPGNTGVELADEDVSQALGAAPGRGGWQPKGEVGRRRKKPVIYGALTLCQVWGQGLHLHIHL